MRWFAAAHLLRQGDRTYWEEVRKRDVQEWIVWLLDRYSAAYASNQYRGMQQFFKWLAGEDEIPDPTAGLKPPHVPDKPAPVVTGEELSRLERACAGRGFQARRDAAATWTCGTGRSPFTARAAVLASSRSVTTPPAPVDRYTASAPGTPRPTGRSCGSG